MISSLVMCGIVLTFIVGIAGEVSVHQKPSRLCHNHGHRRTRTKAR